MIGITNILPGNDQECISQFILRNTTNDFYIPRLQCPSLHVMLNKIAGASRRCGRDAAHFLVLLRFAQ